MAEEYITQVSEEIEWRVTKNLFLEFNRTDFRILVALFKFDEVLLNPQVRTCYVALPGTSRKNNSESREPADDRSLDDSCPEVVFSACHTSNLNDSEQEETYTSYGDKSSGRVCILFPWDFDRKVKKRRARQVSHNSAVKTPPRHLKQIRFCWTFNNWQRTAILPFSKTTSIESGSCPIPSNDSTHF